MEIEFKNKRLRELYESGKSRKYPQEVVDKYVMRVYRLALVEDIHDLWVSASSLNFERLQGYKNRFSMRIDRGWRLEFEMQWQDKERTKGIVQITKISKHYGD